MSLPSSTPPFLAPEPSPDEPPPGHLALTRRELHEKVWSMPMTRLARTFRCSSTWLAEICADAGVPVPGRGYWARSAPASAHRDTDPPQARPPR